MIDNKTIQKRISANIRRLLKAGGINQADFARMCFSDRDDYKLTQSERNIVSQWIKGKRAFSAGELLAIAEVFDVTPRQLAAKKQTKSENLQKSA